MAESPHSIELSGIDSPQFKDSDLNRIHVAHSSPRNASSSAPSSPIGAGTAAVGHPHKLQRDKTVHNIEAEVLTPYTKAFFALSTVAIGFALVAQASQNVRLGNGLGSGLYAAVLNFVTGVFAPIPFASADIGMSQMFRNMASAPWYLYTAGILGSFFVASSILVSPEIGLAMFFSLVVSGQLLSGIILDHLGLFGLPKRRATVFTVVGLLGALGGTIVLQDVANQGDTGLSVFEVVGYSLISFFAGFGLPVQATFNQQASRFLGNEVRATILANLVGLIGLLIGSFVVFIHQGWSFSSYTAPSPFYVWFLPLLVGVFFVYYAASVGPKKLGLTGFNVCLVLGQLTGSLFLDAVGYLSDDTTPATTMRSLGVIIAFAGVVIATAGQSIWLQLCSLCCCNESDSDTSMMASSTSAHSAVSEVTTDNESSDV
jgi:bacterial/archaeal transporter family-2 protein